MNSDVVHIYGFDREDSWGTRNWPVQFAKARFSQLLETCLREDLRSSRDGAAALDLEYERVNASGITGGGDPDLLFVGVSWTFL